jgi:phosphoribosylanthranilate isomerase
MDGAQRARQVAAAKNQSLFREVNERIATVGVAVDEQIGYVCECLDTDCVALINLSTEQYEAVRASGSERFFVLPTHAYAEVEEVVETHSEYVVVAKIRAAGEVAAALDPRRRS